MYKKHKDIIIKIFKPLKKEFSLLVGLLFLLSMTDVAIPYASKIAIDRFIVPRNMDGIGTFIAIYASVIFVFSFIIFSFITVAGRIESNLSYLIRKEAFNKMQDFKFNYFDSEGVGKVLSKITSDIGKLSDIISWGIVDLVWATTFMTFLLAIMFFIYWKLALLVAIIIPVLVIISYYFQHKIFINQKKVRSINAEVTRLINEGITGALTSKVLVTEEKNTLEFVEKTDEMRRHSIHGAILSSIYLPLTVNIGSVGIAMIIAYGGYQLDTGAITLGTLVLFINYATMFFEPVRQAARVISEMQGAKAAAERVLGHLSQEFDMKVEDPDDNFDIVGHIEFDQVSFSYDDREVVLDNFSLDVKAGEKIALVGETGAGKSTIVNLICKFYSPTDGTIKIDGKDYSRISREKIQSNLGYVLQTPQLFSGTIAENIKYGRLDASMDEIIEAARMAQADDFISNLEEGYSTKVGEGGAKLSSGEKQLISIARAILSNSKLFVLDEATSSIDIETEKRIQVAIQNVLKDRTSFIIAHRLSTVKFVDKILLIRDGKILESGNHEQLMIKKGEYYKLYMNQFVA